MLSMGSKIISQGHVNVSLIKQLYVDKGRNSFIVFTFPNQTDAP